MNLIEIYEANPGFSQKELNDLFKQEEKRLNKILLSYLPELHKRLQLSYGEALQLWLDTDEFQSVQLKATSFDELVDNIRTVVANTKLLEPGVEEAIRYCPFTLVTDAVLQDIRAFVKSFLLKQNASDRVREISREITDLEGKGRFSSLDAQYEATFFILEIMEAQEVAQELQALWILNTTLYESPVVNMLFIDSEPCVYFSKTWNLCRDILPAEIIEILDSKYDSSKEGINDENR